MRHDNTGGREYHRWLDAVGHWAASRTVQELIAALTRSHDILARLPEAREILGISEDDPRLAGVRLQDFIAMSEQIKNARALGVAVGLLVSVAPQRELPRRGRKSTPSAEKLARVEQFFKWTLAGFSTEEFLRAAGVSESTLRRDLHWFRRNFPDGN